MSEQTEDERYAIADDWGRAVREGRWYSLPAERSPQMDAAFMDFQNAMRIANTPISAAGISLDTLLDDPRARGALP